MRVTDLATSPVYTITPARPKDLAVLPAIELAAARLLVGHAPEFVLNETTSDEVVKTAQRHGRLWVALAELHEGIGRTDDRAGGARPAVANGVPRSRLD
jgi:hypothetical protein